MSTKKNDTTTPRAADEALARLKRCVTVNDQRNGQAAIEEAILRGASPIDIANTISAGMN